MSVGAVNKQTGARIPTAGMPAIDDALDLTSVNPVQNAVITAALALKQDKTDNNLDTEAKTIVGAINEHESDIDSLKSGLTNHENKNNVVIGWDNRNLWDEQGEQGIYNTETGEKGTGNNFRCKNYIPCEPETNYYMVKPNIGCYVLFYTNTKQFIRSISLNADSHVVTTPQNAEYITFYMFLAYGTTYNNDISFNADNTDTVYHKYHQVIGDTLTELGVALSVPDGTGKNILPMTLDGIKAKNTTGMWNNNEYTANDLTFTINTDNNGYITGITINGTASAETSLVIMDYIAYPYNTSLTVSGCPAGGSDQTYNLQWWLNGVGTKLDLGDGVTFTTPGESKANSCVINIKNGISMNNATYYPMIRLASITDPTFAPYIPSVESRIEAVESGLTNVASKVPIRGDFTVACNAGVNVFHRDSIILVRGRIPTSAFDNCLFNISNHGAEANCPNTIETDGNDILINAKSAQNLRVTWLDMSNIPKYSVS